MTLTKVSRTFPVRLDFELNKAFNAICVRHGDVTYHLEQALKAYGPIKRQLTKQDKKGSTHQRFVKPTYTEVFDYFKERGVDDPLGCETQRFIDFYESKGWMVGSSPMKNWKAAVRNWIKRIGGDGQNKPNGTTKPDRLTPIAKVQANRAAAAQRGCNVGSVGDNDQAIPSRMDEQGGGGTNGHMGSVIDATFTRTD